jgi:hypothetical protein
MLNLLFLVTAVALAKRFWWGNISGGVASITFVVLVLAIGSLPFIMTGDGTLRGRLQTFISYSTMVTGFLLSIMTLILSASTLASEIKNRQIWSVVVKPIPRWQVIAGKLFGVATLNAVFLVVAGLAIYLLTLSISRGEEDSDEDRRAVNDRVLVARQSILPEFPDVDDRVEAHMKKMEEADELPERQEFQDRTRVLTKFRMQQGQWTTRPGGSVHWIVGGAGDIPKIDGKYRFTIRFKCVPTPVPPSEKVLAVWRVGPPHQGLPAGEFSKEVSVNTVHEMEIETTERPFDDRGRLGVNFINGIGNGCGVQFPLNGGIEILYPRGTFGGNLARAMVQVWVRTFLFACMGLAAATFLSFPVSILLCSTVLMIGLITPFLQEGISIMFGLPGAELGQSGWQGRIFGAILRFVLDWLIPNIGRHSPVNDLIDGRFIDWTFVGEAIWELGAPGALLIIIGMVVFRSRELARIVVT